MIEKTLWQSAVPESLRKWIRGRLRKRMTPEGEVRVLRNRLIEVAGRVRTLEHVVDALIEGPDCAMSPDIGFNSQSARQAIFKELNAEFSFVRIIETGTWLGNTTGYLAQKTRLPVFSSELEPRYYALAKRRLTRFPNVRLYCMDSRKFLNELAEDSGMTKGTTFFYLDAHWYGDLPLLEEIQIISNHWDRFVIMVDDFKVPGDDGYGYDDYGGGKALTLEYLKPALARHNLGVFFPACPSQQETGKVRGCVVLVREGPLAVAMEKLSSLRAHEGGPAVGGGCVRAIGP